MALLTYNSLPLPYTDTTSFNQVTVMEDSNTDWILTRFDISVQCILNAAFAEILDASLVNASGAPKTVHAADFMNLIRKLLLAPRKRLSFQVGGVELIPQKASGNVGVLDAKNGPLPQSCTIVQLTDSTFLLNYSITAHYWETTLDITSPTFPTAPTSQGGAGKDVLTNRWTETVDLDAGGYSTRRRSGRFILRSDNPDGLIADKLRVQMAAVKVLYGFRRTASSYTLDPSGLALSYSFTDQEVYLEPPYPAYEAEGSYTESISAVGAKRRGHVTLRLKGSNTTNKSALISVGAAICTAKLWRSNSIQADTNQLGLITGASVRVSLYSNEVELQMSNLFQTNVNRMAGVTAFTDPGPSDVDPKLEGLATAWTPLSTVVANGVAVPNGAPPDYFLRGTALLLLQAAAYYDPSVQTVINQATGQLNSGREPGQAGKTGE